MSASASNGGRLIKNGEPAAARTLFEESLAIAQRLAAANPSSADAQRDVGISLEKLGDVLMEAGELAAARLRYEASLTIAQPLASANPSNAVAQRNVSVSLNKLGDVLMKAGELPMARTRYEASLTIRQRLAAANPSSTAARDLIMSHVKLGTLGSTEHWLEALRLVEALLANGLLAPADQPLLALIRKQASAVR